MNKQNKVVTEDATPKPQDLIKSISEQGYSLEAALADLIDNCISAEANNVEVIIDHNQEPYTLYLADNGNGMSEEKLKASMQFPSDSPESDREMNDLGRFGLGMKTASFSQTRKFTVISREKDDKKYKARTWDVDLLKNGKWLLVINNEKEIQEIIENYNSLSNNFVNRFEGFEPNTIVVWHGLYKFENYIEPKHRKNALKKEITEITSEHLSLVFHRFMESKGKKLKIRINNKQLSPFNPFPINQKDLRPIEIRERTFGSDSISVEGFVLPSRAISETRQGSDKWTTKHMGLMDMEGVYIYRVGRIISFGGWSGMIKKAPRLQLARLRVEIGNKVDHLLHLNVAKSQVIIPHDLRPGFESYVEDLKLEAEREYHNRGLKKFSNRKDVKTELFEQIASNKGAILEVNKEFPIYKSLSDELLPEQLSKFRVLMRLVSTKINSLKKTHEPRPFVELNNNSNNSLSEEDILLSIDVLLDNKIDKKIIKNTILPEMGYTIDTLPEKIIKKLN